MSDVMLSGLMSKHLMWKDVVMSDVLNRNRNLEYIAFELSQLMFIINGT